MEFNLNNKLKSLRKNHGNTQEDLARYLGISIQSVSKWECGDGMPDMTLLPRIAIFYGVSTDYLLGVNEIVKNEKTQKFIDQYNKIRYKETYDGLPDVDYGLVSGIELLRQAVRELPDNWFFYQLLASDLWHYSKSLSNPEKSSVLKEAETLCHLILQSCRENRYRHCAEEVLCLVLNEQGKHYEALEIARSMPDATGTKDFMLTFLLEGEELEHQLYVCAEFYLRTLYRCVKKIEEQGFDPSPLKTKENVFRFREIERICMVAK